MSDPIVRDKRSSPRVFIKTASRGDSIVHDRLAVDKGIGKGRSAKFSVRRAARTVSAGDIE